MLNRATWQIVAVSVLMLAVCAHVPAARPDFAAAVENHLAAIKAKDINALRRIGAAVLAEAKAIGRAHLRVRVDIDPQNLF